MLSKFFKFDERKTNTKQEVLAGITTFLSMAYIIGVNPVMLSKAGMPFSGVFFATIISAAIASILMGVFANYPVGLAPVMGLNALFTYTIVIYLGNTWECAVAAIFLILRYLILLFNLLISSSSGWSFFLIPFQIRLSSAISTSSFSL